jgi:uncharacterized membrane protein YbhN (UPF0104 family)
MENKFLKSVLTIFIGFGFLFYVYNFFDFEDTNFNKILNLVNIKLLFLGSIIYLLSHLIRSFRLILMSEDYNYSYRKLIIEQFKANGFNLLLPFKLGESYRLIAFRQFFGSYSNSFSLLLTERFFDFFAIIAFFCIGLLISSADIKVFEDLFYISLALFLIITLIFFVLKDILVILQKNVMLKKPSNTNESLIKISSRIINSLDQISKTAKNKILALSVITLIIWGLEFSVFLIFYDFLQGKFDLLILLGVAVALSTFLPNGPAGIGGIQLAFYIIGEILGSNEALSYSLIYSLFIFGSGLVVACVLFLFDGLRGVIKK